MIYRIVEWKQINIDLYLQPIEKVPSIGDRLEAKL